MKEFKCYDCDQSFKASSREEILNILYAHYMSSHKEIITGVSEAEKKAWMEQFEKDWAAAPRVT